MNHYKQQQPGCRGAHQGDQLPGVTGHKEEKKEKEKEEEEKKNEEKKGGREEEEGIFFADGTGGRMVSKSL